MIAQREEVEAFLQRVREAARNDRIRFWGERKKNRKCFIDLRLTENDVVGYLANLEIEDYCEGPAPDEKGNPRMIWVFGLQIRDVEIYVRLADRAVDSHDHCVCISFHPSEHPLTYPYRSSNQHG